MPLQNGYPVPLSVFIVAKRIRIILRDQIVLALINAVSLPRPGLMEMNS